MKFIRKQKVRERFGPVTQKILLLLKGGLVLGLTANPSQYFQVIDSIEKEWKEISRRTLKAAIRQLYVSKMLDCKENNDGTFSVILCESGKEKALQYDLENIRLTPQKKWDGLWRMVLFDIPEHKKKERDALSSKLKKMGFKVFQKSVFIYPYECRDEVDFLVEVFQLRPYVRFLLVKEIDTGLHFKDIFKLL